MRSSKTLCAARERGSCADYIVYLLREILVTIECCLCIGIKACILSVPVHQVHVVCACMNEGLFLNMAATRKKCSSTFFLKAFDM